MELWAYNIALRIVTPGQCVNCTTEICSYRK